jgi:hypothetical protein
MLEVMSQKVNFFGAEALKEQPGGKNSLQFLPNAE